MINACMNNCHAICVVYILFNLKQHTFPLNRNIKNAATCAQVIKFLLWASCQIGKLRFCACAGNAGNVFPATVGLRSRHESRHVRDARDVMHAGIANGSFLGSRRWRKRSRHSRRMRNPPFYVSGKGLLDQIIFTNTIASLIRSGTFMICSLDKWKIFLFAGIFACINVLFIESLRCFVAGFISLIWCTLLWNISYFGNHKCEGTHSLPNIDIEDCQLLWWRLFKFQGTSLYQ